MARPIPEDQLDDARRKMMAHQAEESGKSYSPVPPLSVGAWKRRLILDIRLWLLLFAAAVVFAIVSVVFKRVHRNG